MKKLHKDRMVEVESCLNALESRAGESGEITIKYSDGQVVTAKFAGLKGEDMPATPRGLWPLFSRKRVD